MTRPHVLRRAGEHIRNLRVAGGRDFAVSGYVSGPIVEHDMRGMLLAAADSMDELVAWVETELTLQTKRAQPVRPLGRDEGEAEVNQKDRMEKPNV